ncbi:MAG: 16S rRNA (guanine(527)-N(7))-methyltransferase RsmG [Micavibrio sp.]|nr:16S rRNA (guanine(527)-N(7))-methyltransferase RsmG [Micavibrio sp.]
MQPEDLEAKLNIYEALLKKWQAKINLVSSQTLGQARLRHFEDSLQLLDYIGADLTVYDLGSGGGFPGLVMAMAKPDLSITLIESDQRKCAFLRTVSRETSTEVDIVNQRIEDVTLPAPDVVTARALASVQNLLFMTKEWTEQSNLECYFLKGANFKEEVSEARDAFDFSCNAIESKTNADAAILQINSIYLKKAHVNNE